MNTNLPFIVLGMFEGRKPIMYILDSDLIKAITIRDFDHFTDRNTLSNAEPRYLSQSLLNLKVVYLLYPAERDVTYLH